MKKFIWSFVIVVIFVISGFVLVDRSSTNLASKNDNYVTGYVIKYVKIAGQNIKVDLAVTPSEHVQGLSGRAELREDDGLLFVFEYPDKYRFWMKDMNFPIDMIWIGEDLKIIYIKEDARPELYPETYGPDASLSDAKYVLEVVSGFSAKNNLKVGDSIEFVF